MTVESLLGPPSGRMSGSRGRGKRGKGGSIARIVVGVVIVAWTVLPLYWGVVLSISTPGEIRKVPISLFPSAVTGGNYAKLLDGASQTSTDYLRALMNSTILGVSVTILTVLIGLPAAYAFARVHSRLVKLSFLVVVVTMALPGFFLLIPLFQIFSSIHQINTYQSVILVLVSGATPLAVWIMRSHIASIPIEIEQAARIDGAGTGTLIARIIAPLVGPGCVAAGIIAFLAAWGSFLLPVIFTSGAAKQPVTVLIPQYASKYSFDYGLQAAAAIIALLPPAILVVVLRRYLLSGLLAGTGK